MSDGGVLAWVRDRVKWFILRPARRRLHRARRTLARWRWRSSFPGACPICGVAGRFARDQAAVGASYPCASCGGSLRYQGQGRVLVRRYATRGATSLKALCDEPDFRALRIWEPGELGPFRSLLGSLPGYETSVYMPGVPGGTVVDGVRCEDVMALTYPSESFDLVITSDVFEHVRRPYEGFAEVHRVLRSGGAHVWSVPVRWPLRKKTIERVDVSGDDDVFLMEPARHNGHLVYNDFGADMLERLDEIGFDTEVVHFDSENADAARLLTFCSVKRPRQ